MNHDTQAIQQQGRQGKNASETSRRKSELREGEIIPTPQEVARFWEKVDKNGPVVRPELGPCWAWTASRDRKGYGMMGITRTTRKSHRISWTLENGAIPLGLCVLHKCDNTSCVRPSHLFLGTRVDNNADMRAKGRAAKGPALSVIMQQVIKRGDESWSRNNKDRLARGEKHGLAKVNCAAVKKIRERVASGEVDRVIALDYGVTRGVIYSIRSGLTWRHVS